jgi:hypothetical protein
MPRVVERVKRLRGEEATLYLWSSGGADHARESAEALGIFRRLRRVPAGNSVPNLAIRARGGGEIAGAVPRG